MNKMEAKELVEFLIDSYGSKFHTTNPDDDLQARAKKMARKITLWLKFFGGNDFDTVMEAVENHVATSKYPPAIAEIRQQLTAIENPELTETASQAWESVMSACSRFGRDRGTEAMASLSPIAAQVTRSLGYSFLCGSPDIMANRAHFLKMYAEMQDVMSTKVACGESLQGAIEGNSTKRIGNLVKQIGMDK